MSSVAPVTQGPRGNDAARARSSGREALDEVNRTVPAPAAADCDREVAAVVALELGEPALEQAADVLEEALDGLLRIQVRRNRLVAAGQRAEGGFVVRVGQHARIDHPVSVQRDAVAVGE
jgi:hypothetical protein